MNIHIEQLSKRFVTNRWIIKNMNLQCSSNTIYGISGQNGSGKTTLISMMSGLLVPTQGKIKWIHQEQVLSEQEWFHYLNIAAPYADLFEYLTIEELLDFHLKCKSFYDNMDATQFLDLCYLQPNKHSTIKSLSSGMKQRLKLCLAILTQSEVIFLDEPRSNLDTFAQQWYQELLLKFRKNRLIIIASNDAADFDLVDEVIQLNE